MTKLEILNNYTLDEIRDSWAALGSATITANSRIYNKEQIYKIDNPLCPLNGSLLYCKKEYIGNDLDWSQAVLVEMSDISFGNNIISENFTLVMTSEEFETITSPIDENFIPFYLEFQNTSDIKISDDELDIILLEVGVPFVRLEELEYTRQQIANLMIKPALQEYFKWFPKTTVESYNAGVTKVQEFEFPENAYSVIHVSVQQGMAQGATTNTLLRYFDEVVWSSRSPMMGNVGGRQSPRTRTGGWGDMMLDRSVRQGMINYASRVHYRVLNKNGKKYLSCYTNKTGQIQVHYAIQSNDWNDIEFARLPEARKLATAKVMRALAGIRSQAKADIPGMIDYDKWMSRADDLENKVLEDWKDLVKTSGIIRGSF